MCKYVLLPFTLLLTCSTAVVLISNYTPQFCERFRIGLEVCVSARRGGWYCRRSLSRAEHLSMRALRGRLALTHSRSDVQVSSYSEWQAGLAGFAISQAIHDPILVGAPIVGTSRPRSTPTMDWSKTRLVRQLRVPLWPLLVAFMTYPIVVVLRRILRRHRWRKHGCCLRCGYDLKGNTSGVCSECGTPIPPEQCARLAKIDERRTDAENATGGDP